MENSEKNLSKNRRRRILIDKPLQIKYTLFVLILVLLYSICLGYALYSNSRTTTRFLLESVESNPKLAAKLSSSDTSLLIKTVIAVIINAIVIVYISIFSTHKVAGPLYRFRKHLDSLKGGDFSVRTKLRKNDLLTDIADEFNQTSDSIQRVITQDIAETEKVAQKLEALNEKIIKKQIQPSEVTSVVTGIKNDIEQFTANKKRLLKLK